MATTSQLPVGEHSPGEALAPAMRALAALPSALHAGHAQLAASLRSQADALRALLEEFGRCGRDISSTAAGVSARGGEGCELRGDLDGQQRVVGKRACVGSPTPSPARNCLIHPSPPHAPPPRCHPGPQLQRGVETGRRQLQAAFLEHKAACEAFDVSDRPRGRFSRAPDADPWSTGAGGDYV